MYRFEIFAYTKYRDIECQVRGHSRSLDMTPFDRRFMISC